MLDAALDHLVRGVVDNPDDVDVRATQQGMNQVLRVRVNSADRGRVIGRGGRTINALRTVVAALDSNGNGRIRIELAE